MKLILQIVLWVLIAFFGYQLYNSVIGPVQFNKAKEKKYSEVIERLKDIRKAELAYQAVNGRFTGNFDTLVKFVDNAKFAITVRRDTSYADVEKNKAYGISEGYYIDEIIIDTLSFKPVKDSIFKNNASYKEMMIVPGTDAKFTLKSGEIEKNNSRYSVFEAKVDKKVILEGMDEDLIMQELQVKSLDGVPGPTIKVGSMTEINTSGNWPKFYDKKE